MMGKALIIVVIIQITGILSQDDVLRFKSHNKIKESGMETVKVIEKDERDPSHKVYGPQPYSPTDTGRAENCGNKNNSFELTWKPKQVNPSRGVKFNLRMTANHKLAFGKVDLSIYTGGSHEPFITDAFDLPCIGIQSKFPDVKCPIEKGQNISITYTQTDLTALPPGSYTLKANITNAFGEDFLCAKLDVDIKE